MLKTIGELLFALGTLILGVVSTAAFILALAAVDAWAFSLNWNWFVVPFFAAPHLGVLMALGLFLVLGAIKNFFTGVKYPEEKKDGAKVFKDFIMAFLIGPFAAVMGYIVHMLMLR